ncbi:hypothetical protein CLV59_107387 [Chitinophaga dinghuensis]|uniref:Uncharacterized protein n=1 Tax=Chitinophaga dinghuensis TaxID=1539050 RepID=A0A327VUJ5_9BACT|nr:hypothetical protein [Chitinophaga dinghuensis]RAJ77618.1 hypothetical protein CLV59_107387 [Chitinophaga dinghuensis]
MIRKILPVFMIVFVATTSAMAQNKPQTMKICARLLEPIKTKVTCGIFSYVELLIFSLEEPGQTLREDQKIGVYLQCPAEYTNELIVGESYNIVITKDTSSIRESININTSKDRKLKIIGLIKKISSSAR